MENAWRVVVVATGILGKAWRWKDSRNLQIASHKRTTATGKHAIPSQHTNWTARQHQQHKEKSHPDKSHKLDPFGNTESFETCSRWSDCGVQQYLSTKTTIYRLIPQGDLPDKIPITLVPCLSRQFTWCGSCTSHRHLEESPPPPDTACH